MTDSPLPHDDQLVTMVTVRDGHIFVASSTVLVSKANSVALSIDTSIAAPPEFARGQDVTLLYASGDRVMRLKTTIQETIAEDRITLRPAGEPREGDRRDYRRADVRAGIYVTPSGTDVSIPGGGAAGAPGGGAAAPDPVAVVPSISSGSLTLARTDSRSTAGPA